MEEEYSFSELLENMKNNENFDEYIKNIKNKKNIFSYSFVLMKMLSNFPKTYLDYEKAKKMGRKKGDGKGKWPVKINIDDDYKIVLLLINRYINKKFQYLQEDPEILLKLIFHIYRIIPDKKRREFHLLKKSAKTEEKRNYEMLIKKIINSSSKTEVEIIKKILKKKNLEESIKNTKWQ